MRRLATAALGIGASLLGAAEASAKVEMMVVGRTHTVLAPRAVGLAAATVRIGRRNCRVPARTALAGLLASRVRVTVTDVAGCDPASMFVRSVGGQHNHGLGGWEYKIGYRAPSAGAADPSARIRPGQQLLWYWCERAGACQRSLALSVSYRHKAPHIQVLGFDDAGHGRPAARATVHFGSVTALTDARGFVAVPAVPGRYKVYATKPGAVRSFTTVVGVSR